MAKQPVSVSVVIPVFNNDATLVSQLQALEKEVLVHIREWELIICNDASSDASAAVLRKRYAHNRRVRVIHHSRNRGIAATLKELYGASRKEFIALYSADGDWFPNDVLRLVRQARQTGADLVIGVRDKRVYTPYRRVVSYLYNLLPRVLYGVSTYDAGSIKVFRRSVYRSLPTVSESLFFEAEFIIRASRAGYRTDAIPVSFRRLTEYNQTGGKPGNVLDAARDFIRYAAGRGV